MGNMMQPQPSSMRARLLRRWHFLRKWMTPGLRVKRWLLLLVFGVVAISFAGAQIIADVYRHGNVPLLHYLTLGFLPPLARVVIGLLVGGAALGVALYELNRSILAPLSRQQRAPLVDMVRNNALRQKGLRVVALGGGTGLPVVLRSFKAETRHITAIVTMADDGGSSGRLRQELGVLPPGDLRNNIAALANDEDLMAQLLQYRFADGGLEGHNFGNLFLTALADITGSMDRALAEAGKVLVIEGSVLPSTLQDVTLVAEVRDPASNSLRHVIGESHITLAGGRIERVSLTPERAQAYPDTIRAILAAELIVIGPGSLYTSILPTLLINGITEAIRVSSATCIYVCNIAEQQGETDGFTVADHVLALERHIGRGVFSVVLANNAYPAANAGERTRYIPLAAPDDDIRERYTVYECDLTDPQRPWRHSPAKLYRGITEVLALRQPHGASADRAASRLATQERPLSGGLR
jgi:uncharacterized cofD-like protein